MITEHVLLPVIPGQEDAFEEAFTRAKKVILSAAGCLGLTLSRCVERPNTYLLLVQWQRIEDHMIGFRESAAFLEWRRLLHHFYDPAPVVEHFAPVQSS
jgi:heme-degrading monooxygenase HmoA